MSLRRRLLLFGFALGVVFTARARTWHVDATSGDDNGSGESLASAFRTIQRAADSVRAGDTVVIRPGVYFEQVILRSAAFGTADAPVVFRADAIQRDRVVLSGAAPDIRDGETRWTLADEATDLYAVDYAGPAPARVTYDHVDLFPYGSLRELNTFTTAWAGGSPGPRHGFFYDATAGRLYVRLHADGLYGPSSPNLHTMAVSRPRAKGCGFSIIGKGAAHVIIEGLTFEASGDSAIYTEASNVTIRDNWFFGCAYAVRGTNRGATVDAASDIVIEHCEFSEFSTFNDASELLRSARLSPGEHAPWSTIWHRKTSGRHGLPAGAKNYENGIAVRIGRGWVIRNNYIHDIFEGLSNDGMSNAVDIRIHDNVFARICDNAIETEEHSSAVRIYHNLIQDVFEPFSYQPGDGPPWPGPIFFYGNVVTNTPANAALWRPAPHEARGLFKIGISLRNWNDGRNADVPRAPLAVPSPGLLFFNNSLYFPGGRFVTLLGDHDVPLGNVLFAYNLIATDFVLSADPKEDLPAGFFTFRGNLAAPTVPGVADALSPLAGEGPDAGRALPTVADLGWVAPDENDFRLREDSIARGRSGVVPGAEADSGLIDVGAIQPGDTWFPPRVGPRVDPVAR